MAAAQIAPAQKALRHDRQSMARMPRQSEPSPSAIAGTSSIRLIAGKNVGDRAVIQVIGVCRPGENRPNSQCNANTSTRMKGNSQSFHIIGESPRHLIPMAHQYGSTGGHCTGLAGSGHWLQYAMNPYGFDGC